MPDGCRIIDAFLFKIFYSSRSEPISFVKFGFLKFWVSRNRK